MGYLTDEQRNYGDNETVKLGAQLKIWTTSLNFSFDLPIAFSINRPIGRTQTAQYTHPVGFNHQTWFQGALVTASNQRWLVTVIFNSYHYLIFW